MTTTTVDIDTELSAVNAILGSIGQSPISQIDFANPEIAFIYNILKEVNQDVQTEGWTFNIEYHIKETVNSTTNKILWQYQQQLVNTDHVKVQRLVYPHLIQVDQAPLQRLLPQLKT